MWFLLRYAFFLFLSLFHYLKYCRSECNLSDKIELVKINHLNEYDILRCQENEDLKIFAMDLLESCTFDEIDNTDRQCEYKCMTIDNCLGTVSNVNHGCIHCLIGADAGESNNVGGIDSRYFSVRMDTFYQYIIGMLNISLYFSTNAL